MAAAAVPYVRSPSEASGVRRRMAFNHAKAAAVGVLGSSSTAIAFTLRLRTGGSSSFLIFGIYLIMRLWGEISGALGLLLLGEALYYSWRR